MTREDTVTKCTTCSKYVEKPCKSKQAKNRCFYNKLRPVSKVKPIKNDPDHGK